MNRFGSLYNSRSVFHNNETKRKRVDRGTKRPPTGLSDCLPCLIGVLSTIWYATRHTKKNVIQGTRGMMFFVEEHQNQP